MVRSDRFFIVGCLTVVFLLAAFSCPYFFADAKKTKPVDVVSFAFEEDGPIVEGPRSSRWPTVRAEHLRKYPCCEICGKMDFAEVHHVKPFRTNPELELDPKNLVTLCRGGKNHHFQFGHDPDGIDGPRSPNWKESNPYVLEDIKKYHRKRGTFD